MMDVFWTFAILGTLVGFIFGMLVARYLMHKLYSEYLDEIRKIEKRNTL